MRRPTHASGDRSGGKEPTATSSAPDGLLIDTLTAADWPAVRRIHEQGIATGDATFETVPPTWAEWDRAHLTHSRLVARLGDRVVAWAALGAVSDRCAYAGVAENSIYVDESERGRGVGRALLIALVAQAEARGLWTVQTGIFPENRASLALHLRCGFRVVGTREAVGRLDGRWRDVLLLERRSRVVGTDDPGDGGQPLPSS